MRFAIRGCWALMVTASLCSAAQAQEPALVEAYGRGVHAFYAGRLEQAHELFSAAINHGSTDPRVFYFRGLTALCQGWQANAETDFATGAQFEVSGGGGSGIGKSLERIQGAPRHLIESFRFTARLNAVGGAPASVPSLPVRPTEPLNTPAPTLDPAPAPVPAPTPMPPAGPMPPVEPMPPAEANPFGPPV